MRNFNLLLLTLALLIIGGCSTKQPSTAQQEEKPDADAFVSQVKIAMILPEKRIGRYAESTSTALFAYLISRDHPFILKTYTVQEVSKKVLEETLEQIEADGFHYVIAPLTLEGAKNIAQIEAELFIYLPTIHMSDLQTDNPNIYCGAIDYTQQIDALMPKVKAPLVIMYGTSTRGKKLMQLTKERYKQMHKEDSQKSAVLTYGIDRKRSNLRSYFENNQKIASGTLFLNTPIIKSTMVLSQLSVYDVNITNVLSTQVTYNPLLLSMTQKRNREALYIANSITIQDDDVIQANSVLGNDINYDWINYATTVGADYIYHLISGKECHYDLPMQDNQVHYPVHIMQAVNTHFETAQK